MVEPFARTEEEALRFFSNLRSKVVGGMFAGMDANLRAAVWQEACRWAYRDLSVGDRVFVQEVVREFNEKRNSNRNWESEGWSRTLLGRQEGCKRTFERLRKRWCILDWAYEAISHDTACWVTAHTRTRRRMSHILLRRHVRGDNRPVRLPDNIRNRLDLAIWKAIERPVQTWLGRKMECMIHSGPVADAYVGQITLQVSTGPGFLSRIVPHGLNRIPSSSTVYPLSLTEVHDLGGGLFGGRGAWMSRSSSGRDAPTGWLIWSYRADDPKSVEFLERGKSFDQAEKRFWKRFRDAYGDLTPADRAMNWYPEPEVEPEIAQEDLDALEGVFF